MECGCAGWKQPECSSFFPCCCATCVAPKYCRSGECV
jgi:hypothetical protein